MALVLAAGNREAAQADRSDDQLMAAFARKDRAAFDILYNRYKDQLYGYLVRHCRDEAIASELFQDVWLRVISASRKYERSGKFRPWLFTVAHNRLVDFYRRADGEAVGGLEEEMVASNDVVEQTVSVSEQQDRLDALLASLPLEQRQAFYLREECGFAVKEIAAVQDVTVEAAKSRLRYAYGKLREAFQEER